MWDALATLETLALAVDARFGGPVVRTQALAIEIGRRLSWSKADLAALRAAAWLHDLGELAASQPFASGAGSKARIHLLISSAMAEHMGLPGEVISMVRSHHERWDGNGYPDGLRGTAIPPGARILAVADWLAAGPPSRAVEALRRESAAAFDPALVNLVADCFDELECAATRPPLPDFYFAVAAAAREAGKSAVVDELTQLPNSRSLFLRLDAELSRCRRSRTPLAVLVCEAEGLPQAGYPAMAESLRRICREEDCVARLGDAFALVFAGFSRKDLPEKEKLIAASFQAYGGPAAAHKPPLRIGAAFYPEDGASAEDLLVAADSRLSSGRGCQ